MKKLCALLLALCVAALAAGCSSNEPPIPAATPTQTPTSSTQGAAGEDDVVTVRWLILSGMGEDAPKVVREVNRLLEKFTPPLQIQVVDAPRADDYTDYLRMQITAAEPKVDLVSLTMQRGFYNFAKAGDLADLTPLLERYDSVRSVIFDEVWALATVNGRIYGIPTDVFSSSGYRVESVRLLQEDWEVPPVTIRQVYDWIDDRHSYDSSVLLYQPDELPYYFHRAYDEWPFDVDLQGLFLYTGDGEVSAYVESDIFARDIGWFESFRAGEMLFAVDEDSANDLIAGTLGYAYSERMEDREYGYFYLEPDGVRVASPGRDFLVIPSGADAENAFMLLDLLYTNHDAYMLLMHGIEDEHYRMMESDMGFFYPQTIFDGRTYYNGAPFGTQSILDVPDFDFRSALESGVLSIEEAFGRVMPYTGFEFDPELVRSEYDAVLLAMRDGLYAKIQRGLADSTDIDGMIDELRKAGLDAVVDECDAQYEDFKAMMGR